MALEWEMKRETEDERQFKARERQWKIQIWGQYGFELTQKKD